MYFISCNGFSMSLHVTLQIFVRNIQYSFYCSDNGELPQNSCACTRHLTFINGIFTKSVEAGVFLATTPFLNYLFRLHPLSYDSIWSHKYFLLSIVYLYLNHSTYYLNNFRLFLCRCVIHVLIYTLEFAWLSYHRCLVDSFGSFHRKQKCIWNFQLENMFNNSTRPMFQFIRTYECKEAIKVFHILCDSRQKAYNLFKKHFQN